MFDIKLLIITSIQASNNRQELENKINNLPGQWDIINLDGTLSTVNNKPKNIEICNNSYTRLAYIKSGKDSHRDNRTYQQVDSMEVYIKYKILKNPNIHIADANLFSDYSMDFDIDSIVEELGVSKKNILYTCKL